MSATESPKRNGTDTIDELPTFEYECLYDDEEDPTEVTIFVDTLEDLSTHWITIDKAHAVSLDEIA